MPLRLSIGYGWRLALLAAAFCCLLLPAAVSASDADIFIVLSNDTDEYRQVEKAIVEGLRDSRHYRRRLRTMLAATLDPALTEKWPHDADLVVAVGMRALKRLLENPPDFPIYAVMVPYVSYQALLDALPKAQRQRLAVLYLDQPPRRQLELVKALNGPFARLGILLAKDSRFDLAALQRVAAELEVELRPVRVDDRREVVPVLKRTQRRIDLLITVFEPEIINTQTVRQILYFSYNRRLPVVGYSQAMVRAGALAAVYSDAAQVGRQAAETLIGALDHDPPRLPAAAFPKYFRASCNEAVRAYFNLPTDCRLRQFSSRGEGR